MIFSSTPHFKGMNFCPAPSKSIFHVDSTRLYHHKIGNLYNGTLRKNDKTLGQKHCDFRFHLNHLSAQIVKLSKSTILERVEMIKVCNFCLMSIPCECDVSTPQMYLLPRLAACINNQESITTLHTVNLILLQQFFNSSDLSNITGNSMFIITQCLQS